MNMFSDFLAHGISLCLLLLTLVNSLLWVAQIRLW